MFPSAALVSWEFNQCKPAMKANKKAQYDYEFQHFSHLFQEFHVAYVFIKMANSPRPGVFALERSTDYGKTWDAWQYFADTYSDCATFFGEHFEDSITRDDSVICTTDYSHVVPLEGGEVCKLSF